MADRESIPDTDEVYRSIYFPFMYSQARSLIWENVFQFPGGSGESVMWSKYVADLDAVHAMGCDTERRKRGEKPEFKYEGAIVTGVGAIRGVRSKDGHALDVIHEPDEGVHHAEIKLAPVDGKPFSKNHKNELKFGLRQIWGPLLQHSCRG